MKKITVFILALIIIMIMSFPASALVHMQEVGHVTAYNIERVDIAAKTVLPDDYIYRLVVWSPSADNGYFTVYYSNTPLLTSSTPLYSFNQNTNEQNVKLPSILRVTYGFSFWYEYFLIQHGSSSPGAYLNSRFSGYLTNYSTALPSNIAAMQSAALAAGYDLEYYLDEVIDTSELESLLSLADKITNVGYTTSSWNTFTAARTDGHALLSQSTYTLNQIITATNKLRQAMDGLTLNAPVDPLPIPSVNYMDIANGINLNHLVPAETGVWDMFKAAIKFGISIFAVILALYVILRIIKSSVGHHGGGSSDDLRMTDSDRDLLIDMNNEFYDSGFITKSAYEKENRRLNRRR